MRIKRCLNQLLKSFDLFSTSQFLRFKEEEAYQTASGGITSLLVISIFLILFANTAIQTVNKSIIYWTSNSQNYFQPTKTKMSFAPEDKFMITVGIMGLDITDKTKRYFDIQMIETHVGAGGVVLGTKTIDLEPCTIQHFSITQKLKNNFGNMNALKRLCPPLNYSYQLYGKFTSKQMQYLQVRVNKCNDTLDPSRPCVSDSVIDNLISILGQFTVGLFYVNPLINPGSQDYLDYYFEDRNFLSFTKTLGAYSFARVQDYTIETDYSLLPLTETQTDQGIIIPELFQVIPYEVTSDSYASFYFMKSATATTYQRSFNKVDQLFSYVGGLVGTILGFMLFMGNFTMMSFELQIGQKMFKGKDGQRLNVKDFNLFTYLMFLVYKFGRLFGRFHSWNQMKKRRRCKEQVIKQLDISFLLQRISFLERTITSMAGNDISPYQRETFKMVKARRKQYQNAQKDNQEDISQDSNDSEHSQSRQNPSEDKKPTKEPQVPNYYLSQFNLNNDLQYFKGKQPIQEARSARKRKSGSMNSIQNEALQRGQQMKEEESAVVNLRANRNKYWKKVKIQAEKVGQQDSKGSIKDIEFNQSLFFQQLILPKTD